MKILNLYAGIEWVVENVKPYYEPLIKPDYIFQRHYFWCNFKITPKEFKTDLIRKSQIPDLQKKYKINLSPYSLENKRQILRNCVMPELGLHILNESKRDIQPELFR